MKQNIDYKKLLLGMMNIVMYIFFIPLFCASLFQIFLPSLIQNNNELAVNICSFSIYLITIAYLLFTYRASIIKEFQEYIKKLIPESFKTWFLGFLFMIVSNPIVINIVGSIANNEEANRSIIASSPVYAIVSMVILGPIIEEFLFRKAFQNVFKNKYIFFLVTSFLFGFAHIFQFLDFTSFDSFIQTAPQLLFLIPYGGIGYIYAQSFYKHKNIFVSTGAHILQNAIAVGITMIGV